MCLLMQVLTKASHFCQKSSNVFDTSYIKSHLNNNKHFEKLQSSGCKNTARKHLTPSTAPLYFTQRNWQGTHLDTFLSLAENNLSCLKTAAIQLASYSRLSPSVQVKSLYFTTLLCQTMPCQLYSSTKFITLSLQVHP